jgi:hypothetical protein
MSPALDPLESRQLLSMATMPPHVAALAHHHHEIRLHHAAAVGQAHSRHHGATPAASTGFSVVAQFNNAFFAATAPAASTGFSVVAQFNNASFLDTAAITDKDIWAVGNSTSSGTNQPFAVHFNGTSWSAVSTPTLSGGGSFSGVTAVASNDVWAVGSQSVSSSRDEPLIEHWNGTSWSVVPSPNLPNGGLLRAVTAISTNDVWAVGENANVSVDLVEHWDGTRWSVVSSPAFNGSIEVMYGISADASNDVWVVGNSPGVILHFGGTSWTRTVLKPALYGGPALKAVVALSPSNVWVVGMVRPSAADGWRPVVEHWDGTNWSGVSSPDPKPNTSLWLTAITAVSANDTWAVGSVGIENWNGTSWSLVSSVPSTGVAALSDGTVVVVSGSGAILEN